MSCKEEWLSLVQRSKIMSREALIEEFIKWVDAFALEEKERTGAFDKWVAWPEEQRKAAMYSILRSEIGVFGNGPQLEGLLLASLFYVLSFGRCIVVATMRIDMPATRKISDAFKELTGQPIFEVGNVVGFHSSLNFADIMDKQVAIADYFMLATTLRAMPQLFPNGLPILCLEADVVLYTNRLIFIDNGIPKSSGMIYKSNSDLFPQWKESDSVYDIPDAMRQLKLEITGSVSYTDKNATEELVKQFPYFFKKKMKVNYSSKYSAFTFRTSVERCEALVNDVLKCETDAFIFFTDEEVGKLVMEQLKKAGQDFKQARDTEDAATILATGKGKHVIIEQQMSSTLFTPPLERKPASVFIADLFISDTSYVKIYSAVMRMGIVEHDIRIYFALEDKLMQIYAEEGGFPRFFSIMDFTEKYDPFKQVRRVMAKMLLRRLDGLRTKILDDNMPIPVTSLAQRPRVKDHSRALAQAAKATKMAEGLCFCGSGKPFKECHGKPKNKN